MITAIAIFSILCNLYFIWAMRRMLPLFKLGLLIAKGMAEGKVEMLHADEITAIRNLKAKTKETSH